MPSHDLSTTSLVTVKPGELANAPAEVSFLERWKTELKFDYEMELGKMLLNIARSRRVAEVDKAEILIKGAAAIKALNKRAADAGGKAGGNNTQVNVYASDPTKK